MPSGSHKELKIKKHFITNIYKNARQGKPAQQNIV